MAAEEAWEEKEEGAGAASAQASTRVTARDRQLLAVLAQARCLSEAQVKRLFWPRQTRQAVQRRLLALSRGARPLVKPLHWYTRDGRRTAWALAPAGYLEAEAELGEEQQVPREDVGPEYLEHHVLLSELFVGLLAGNVEERAAYGDGLAGGARGRALATAYARARHPYFRWVVTADRELPWKEPEGATLRQRVIRPDAILELPHSGRRVFVESETGSHSIAAVSHWKPGSTLGKVGRYQAFCAGLATIQPRRTWYQARFADSLKPEVLFLVRTSGRVRSVSEAVSGWLARRPEVHCRFWAATAEEAVAKLLPLVHLGPSRGEPPGVGAKAPARGQLERVVLTAEEADALRQFVAQVLGEYKERRARARVHRDPVPDYPAGTRILHDLVQRCST